MVPTSNWVVCAEALIIEVVVTERGRQIKVRIGEVINGTFRDTFRIR